MGMPYPALTNCFVEANILGFHSYAGRNVLCLKVQTRSRRIFLSASNVFRKVQHFFNQGLLIRPRKIFCQCQFFFWSFLLTGAARAFHHSSIVLCPIFVVNSPFLFGFYRVEHSLLFSKISIRLHQIFLCFGPPPFLVSGTLLKTLLICTPFAFLTLTNKVLNCKMDRFPRFSNRSVAKL